MSRHFLGLSDGAEPFPRLNDAVGFIRCDVRTDRKSAGLPERRFRLSHTTITNA